MIGLKISEMESNDPILKQKLNIDIDGAINETIVVQHSVISGKIIHLAHDLT